ncbi:DNA-directed RNA polymerase I subunit RPA49-like [Mizuhopecten yessoensis]|uniref:DNA-directed RNA polymerase I subunit RPA49 n=1 Tax=Mizuhopecten yessoensis TaxID=6573 RepID=A0A210QCZ3_MIZYE|nr:DNA-directed RNA polymerase I subunit RPA49-like [Mizuhopecten yessoensis]OWF46596.1 DNA-directed RNA polymerase I subunit RPA49 [Mizuhopecten yessoensis]
MTDVTLEVPSKRKSILIANFTNGQVNRKRCDDLSIGHFTSSQNRPGSQKRKQILVAETDQMAYVGQNFGTSADRSQNFCRYYVGVRDKDTGKMTICDAEIFNMLPKLPGDNQEESQKEDLSLSYAEKNDFLTEAFGSKKKQKAMENRLMNRSAAKSMETIMESASKQALSQRSHEPRHQVEDQTDGIPPCNKEAASRTEVYSLHNIISPGEMEALTTPAQVFFDSAYEQVKQWKEQKTYPEYVTSHLMTMPLAESERWKMSKCLMYLHYLITLNNLNTHTLGQKTPLPVEWPGAVIEQLLKKFTMKVESGGRIRRCRPARLKDKTISYILVLCLMIDEYEVEVTELMMDLKLSLERIQNHFRALGCTFTSKKGVTMVGRPLSINFASLNVPLTFPDPSARKKKKGR